MGRKVPFATMQTQKLFLYKRPLLLVRNGVPESTSVPNGIFFKYGSRSLGHGTASKNPI